MPRSFPQVLSHVTALLFCVAVTVVEPGFGQDRKPTVDFEKDIWPVLQENCIDCHGPDLQEGQLRLDARGGFEDGGVNGKLVGGPTAHDSLLMVRLLGSDGQDQMPLDGDPLPEETLQAVSDWIAAGALWPDGVGAPVQRRVRHWAYAAPQRSVPPLNGGQDWSLSPVDGWVYQAMTEQVLEPSPSADKGKLLRRLCLDLTGLPPSAEELSEFIEDQRPDALERQVDRLLASPHYGQRWARQWLDAARYADSNGYQADQYREVWPYRDWVIQSFNDDKPFDQFTVQQLAGDLLPDASVEDRIATGFHRLTTCNVEAGVDPEENRINQVIDRVNTTATVWLGTTLECCQCHSHKYDPFNQREYYEMFAYFNNTPLEVRDSGNNIQYEFIGPKMDLPLPREIQARRARLTKRISQFRTSVQQRRVDLLAAYRPPTDSAKSDAGESDTGLPSDAADDSATATESQTGNSSQQDSVAQDKPTPEAIPQDANEEAAVPKDIAKLLQREYAKLNAAQKKKVDDFLSSRHVGFKSLRDAMVAAQAELKKLDPTTTLVMIENDSPRQTHIFKRGDFLQPSDPVTPSTPEILHAGQPERPDNRLGLAQWIVDPANPLTSRVTVNRWWGELLGRPLVATTEDFGTQGDRPTHPEVLDWLALEWIRSGWSMKSLHRQIVLTATYRQDSAVTAQQQELDPINRWLARGSRYRLPAETIRDNALRISGVLSERQMGPPVYPPQPPKVWRHVGRNAPVYATSVGEQRYRRGIYVFWRRSAPYPSFVNFDAPDRASCSVKRPRTNTPLQALTLMNDPAYLELAGHLADSILSQKDLVDREARLAEAFRRCVARAPTSDEQLILGELLDEQLTYYESRVGQAEAWVKGQPRRDRPAVEFAAWMYVASTLLNLDETICRD